MNFTAIDFETANERRASACALGVVVVEDGHIVEQRSLLIRPPELRFNRFNIYIHGIGPQHVENEPEFCELWDELQTYLAGRHVLAHNAGFDMSVLRGTLDLYGLDYPDLSYSCTMRIARKVWPGLHRYRLDSIADHLGIEFLHHDALEDARACALIALYASGEMGVVDLPALVDSLNLPLNSLAPIPA